jgi:hypothetical protein
MGSIINRWNEFRRADDNVSINDGVVTYFAEWYDSADDADPTAIDLHESIADFAETYDHDGYSGPVNVTATNLLTEAELTDQIWPEEDEDDEDDEDDEGEDDEGEDDEEDDEEDDNEE